MKAKLLSSRIEKLPEKLQHEVIDFIDFLIQKHNLDQPRNAFSFNWEGGLSDLTPGVTAVDLQHESMEYR